MVWPVGFGKPAGIWGFSCLSDYSNVLYKCVDSNTLPVPVNLVIDTETRWRCLIWHESWLKHEVGWHTRSGDTGHWCDWRVMVRVNKHGADLLPIPGWFQLVTDWPWEGVGAVWEPTGHGGSMGEVPIQEELTRCLGLQVVESKKSGLCSWVQCCAKLPVTEYGRLQWGITWLITRTVLVSSYWCSLDRQFGEGELWMLCEFTKMHLNSMSKLIPKVLNFPSFDPVLLPSLG